MGFFDKLKKITSSLFSGFTEADEAFFEELEETLIMADLGVDAATDAVEKLRTKVRREHLEGQEAVREGLREILAEEMDVGDTALKLDTKPSGADPGAVLFDALQAAKARNVDVVLCDTAGRLHNKANLMAELGKLSKIIDRECPSCDRETLLVLDATTGQNGLLQARSFKETAGLTGIVLTKLDGTAKGGIVVAIARELGVPVKLAGVGEGIDDLKPFDAHDYAEAII